MAVRRVVQDQIQEDANAAPRRLLKKLHEVAARAKAPVDAVVVGDVVPVVSKGRRLDGCEPEQVDAQALQMVQSPPQAFEVADAVAVCVHECLDGRAVDDRVAEPFGLGHEDGRSQPGPLRNLRSEAIRPARCGKSPGLRARPEGLDQSSSVCVSSRRLPSGEGSVPTAPHAVHSSRPRVE
jgi:hypothetical protein